MSTYITRVRNPKDGLTIDALMIDNYFGNHLYGIQFAGSRDILNVEELDYELEFVDEPTKTPFSKFHFFRSDKEDYGKFL